MYMYCTAFPGQHGLFSASPGSRQKKLCQQKSIMPISVAYVSNDCVMMEIRCQSIGFLSFIYRRGMIPIKELRTKEKNREVYVDVGTPFS